MARGEEEKAVRTMCESKLIVVLGESSFVNVHKLERMASLLGFNNGAIDRLFK